MARVLISWYLTINPCIYGCLTGGVIGFELKELKLTDKRSADQLLFWKINPLRAKFFRRNLKIYLHFVSFRHIDTTQVVVIFPFSNKTGTYLSYIVNIMAADVLAT